jgi:hypothetical protein
MASILGVSENTIVREMGRIERAQESNSPIVRRFVTLLIDPSRSSDYFRAKYREQWIKTLTAHNPSAGRTAMRSKARAAYSWLSVHDRKWLNENLPPFGFIGSRPKKDWSTIDRKYTDEVHKIATKIRDAPGPPVRISQTVIAKILGIHGNVFKSPNLPKTKAALIEVADSNTTFAVRRIRWARDCFLRESSSTPRMWRVWAKTHISKPMRANELVKTEWQRCVQELESHHNVL